jgi:hypothetical protein
MTRTAFPPLPLDAWVETKTTLHLFTQIVGKVRLSLTPRVNHWWHVPLYLSSRGLTTSPIPRDDRSFEMELDLIDHELVIRVSDGAILRIGLREHSVASFYYEVTTALAELDIRAKIIARPFDSSRVKSDVAFATDHQHTTYEPEYVTRFWRILLQVDSILKVFRGRFLGKCSPINFYWHSFDLAVTRFSGHRAPVSDDADPVTREAYSHEVISAGFWVGDDNVPAPAFYSYTAPEPAGLAQEPLRPDGAQWVEQNGGVMAVYLYDDMRQESDPRQAALDFLESSYVAGAKRAGWDRDELERG